MAAIYININDSTREFEISPAETSKNMIGIGRSADNQLQISSTTVSNQHARIVSEDNEIIIYDLNSATGTFVNKQPISRHILNINDSIVIGNQELVYAGLKVESSDTSPNQIDEDPKATEFAETGTDDQPEDSSANKVSDSIPSANTEADSLEPLDEAIDIVEPWAHLELQDDTKVSDDHHDNDTLEPRSNPVVGSIHSKNQATSDGGGIQKNNQLELTSKAVETVDSVDNVAGTLNYSVDEIENHQIEVPNDLSVENSLKQANTMPLEERIVEQDSSERAEPLDAQQRLDLAESRVSIHQTSDGESDESTPVQAKTVEDIRESVGQKTIQLERPPHPDDPNKVDFELPAPVSQTELKPDIDPDKADDSIFASTIPDLFRDTTNKPVISVEEQSTNQQTPKTQTKKQQTTLEIVPPAAVQETANVSDPSRGQKSDQVEVETPNDSHLLIQAGPNTGNRAALKHDRTILGINGHQCVAVTRGEDSFMASGLDSEVTVSINGVPLDTKSFALKDGDFLEFFDVRLRFVA